MKNILLLFVFYIIRIEAYAQTNYYNTTDIEIEVKGGKLYGTLSVPAGIKKPPVVLLIAGSGPTDRDGNNPIIPGKNNSLLQIADSLAKHGIACLRYDKRGIAKSVFKNMIEDSINFSDGVNDAIAFYQYLSNKKFKRIYIAGHSEGSLVGMSVAKQVQCSGFISLAGAGRRIDIILKEQLNSLPDNLKEESYTYLDSLAAGKKIINPDKLLYSLFRPSIQPYMISWLQYDPQQIIQSLNCPALIIQGNKDLQVKVLDAENLKKANTKADLLIINNMNHVLKEVISNEPLDNQKTYGNPLLPVMHELISGMVNFIKQKKKH